MRSAVSAVSAASSIRRLDKRAWGLAALACLLLPGWLHGLASGPGTAQTPGKVVVPDSALASAPVQIAQRHLPQQNAVTAPGGSRMRTPFDRVYGPRLQKLFSQRNGQAGGPRAAQAIADGSGIGGSNVSFPGFIGAPYVSYNTNDVAPAYANVSGDFNGDGVLDVASVQADGTLTVILSPGSKGNYSTAAVLPPNTSENAHSPYIAWLVAADMNKDGKLDLVGQDTQGNQIVLWLGNGDGTFQSAVTYALNTTVGGSGSNLSGSAIVVGDFNSDGSLDVEAVVFAENYDTTAGKFYTVVSMQTFANDGNGHLSALPESDSRIGDVYFLNPGQADVVTDGKKAAGIALLVFNNGFNNNFIEAWDVMVIGSNGDGSFAKAADPSSLTGIPVVGSQEETVLNMPGCFRATNLSSSASGSPTTDIVFMNYNGGVYDAPITQTSGSFNPPTINLLVGQNVNGLALPGSGSTSGTGNFTTIQYQAALNIADMNGDGLPDLLVYTNFGTDLFLNGGSTGFTSAPLQFAGGVGGYQQPQPGDFTGTGKTSFVGILAPPAVAGDPVSNAAALYAGDGTGNFYAAPLVDGPSTNEGGSYNAFGGNIAVQAAGDLNGDGLTDVVGLDFSYQAVYTGAPYYTALPDIVVGINNGAKAGSLTGNFNFSTAVSIPDYYNLPGVSSAFTDAFIEPVVFTGPGGTQNFMIGDRGGLFIVSGKNGQFSAPVQVISSLGCPINYADAADINGDGIPDIVAAYAGDDTCYNTVNSNVSGYYTILGNADGSFQPAVFTPYGEIAYVPKLIDLNGDGLPDLVLTDAGTFSVYVLPNKGGGNFDTAAVKVALPNYAAVAVIAGDFNGDGKQDLTIAVDGAYDSTASSTGGIAPNTAGVVFLPGNGDFTFGAPQQTLNTGFFAPTWGAYADFNGDGSPDLALALYDGGLSSGTVKVYPNLGGGFFGPSISEFDSSFNNSAYLFPNSYTSYVFPGSYSSLGSNDLIATGDFDSALFVNQGTDALAVAASASSSNAGAPLTLTATLTQPVSNPNQPTGQVSFFSNGALIGTTDIAAAGTASLTTDQLPAGVNAITASYTGDAHHNGATAATAVSVQVATAPPAEFTLSPPTPASLQITPGQTGTATITLAGNASFSGTVSFTCSGAPSQSSCTVAPGSLTLTPGSSSSVAVVLATTAQNGTYQAGIREQKLPWQRGFGSVGLAGFLLLVLPKRRRRALTTLAVLLLVSGAVGLMTGCGGGSSQTHYSGTPAGSYVLQVTATSNGLTHTQAVPVTISAQQSAQ